MTDVNLYLLKSPDNISIFICNFMLVIIIGYIIIIILHINWFENSEETIILLLKCCKMNQNQ